MTAADTAGPRTLKRVALIGKRTPVLLPEVVRRVDSELRARGLEVALDPETSRLVGRAAEGRELAELAGDVDLAVSLGGDGTLLAVARAFAASGTPLVGVNLGRLGFLTEVELTDLPRFLDEYVAGHHVIEQRMMLEARVDGDSMDEAPVAVLNDVVVAKAMLARMLEFGVTVDGVFVTTSRADGLIVATPTGSTAYSLAAGGSIVLPMMDAMVLNPICPHASSQRPLVVPGTSEVRVTLAPGHHDVHVSLDGQATFAVPEGAEIIIRRSPLVTRVVRDPSRTFFHLLRAKLGWNGRLPRA